MARTIDSSDDSSQLAARVDPNAHVDDSALAWEVAIPDSTAKEVVRACGASYKEYAAEIQTEQLGIDQAMHEAEGIEEISAKSFDAFEQKLLNLSERLQKHMQQCGAADQSFQTSFNAELATFRKRKADLEAALAAQKICRDSLDPEYRRIREARDAMLNDSINEHGELLKKETQALKTAYKPKEFSPNEVISLMQQFRVEASDDDSDG